MSFCLHCMDGALVGSTGETWCTDYIILSRFRGPKRDEMRKRKDLTGWIGGALGASAGRILRVQAILTTLELRCCRLAATDGLSL